jgi:hypothetical protein
MNVDRCRHGVEQTSCALCIAADLALARRAPHPFHITAGVFDPKPLEHRFDGEYLELRPELLWAWRWIDGRTVLKESVVLDAPHTLGVTLSVEPVAATAGPGWHPFLNDGADQDDESRPMTFVAAGGRLTISIHLMRKGKLNSALCWRRAPSGGRFIEWSHHLSAWWYFHEHFGPTGKNDKPASSDIAVKLVLVAEPDQGRARD